MDKPTAFEVKTAAQCINCQRAIKVGETATQLPDLDVAGTAGGVLCSNCHPHKGETATEKAARLPAAKEAAAAKKAGK